MLRNLIHILLLSFIFTGCISNTIQRNISSFTNDNERDERVYLQGFESYFPISQNYQEVKLVNKFNVGIKYKIVSLGNVLLANDRGTCKVSGSDNNFYLLPSSSYCTFYILKGNKQNGQGGEVRVYKKSDGQKELIISELINLNTITKNQCQTLVKHAYLAQKPETLHKEQYKIINNKYVFKDEFINDCKTMVLTNVENHHKANLFKYCIDSYFKNKIKPFINNEDGQLDYRSYSDHLNELANFEPDNYCQDIEDL